MSVGLSPGGMIGVTSFVALSHPSDSCGLNGLPLTPNSVCILGNGQLLKVANHPNLAKYLDIVRGKRQRIVMVSEFWKRSLRPLDRAPLSTDTLLSISRQVLEGLVYLNQMNIVNLNLNPDNVMLDENGNVKLFGYGLGRITEYGKLVSFPIGDPRFTAPDVFKRGMLAGINFEVDPESSNGGELPLSIPEESQPPDLPQVDVWSLGMILSRILLEINQFWPQSRVGQVLRKIVSLGECENGTSVLEKLAREHGCIEKIGTVDPQVLQLIHTCLTPCSSDRPSPAQLLSSEIFLNQTRPAPTIIFKIPAFPVMELRSKTLVPPDTSRFKKPLDFLTVRETYYLWQLAGRDVMAELRKHGLMITTPPVISTPTLVSGEGQEFGVPRERAALYDNTIISLPLEQLTTCLSTLPRSALLPTTREIKEAEINELPLVIREKDVRFQCRRVIAYRRLLQGYPFRLNQIIGESEHDVVPLYRAEIWSALLGINYDIAAAYDSIDKDTPNPVDRQIEVDIPRCHQYNELLASHEGHRKLKRVLKAWVVSNPSLVYWQGLDSLAAPFLLLNFNNEPSAWASLSAFIPKYLCNMFQKDNASVIQEYLAKFSHLQAFYDPELFNHLDDIGFIPDLYAIPWVLTMFSHVFPLHKIFHLWDTLLLGDSSYPLCVGLAILLQLRDQLMESQFNECILLFSEMPSVDIDLVVSASKRIFKSIPPSLMYRAHDKPRSEMEDPGSILDLGPLSISTLKTEKVGRISGRDVIDLLDLRNTKYADLNILVVDIRARDEFKVGSLPGAVNLPAQLFLELGTVPASRVLEAAREAGSVIAVLGREREDNMTAVAEIILQHHVPHVVTVHGGIDIFRRADILVLPSLDS